MEEELSLYAGDAALGAKCGDVDHALLPWNKRNQQNKYITVSTNDRNFCYPICTTINICCVVLPRLKLGGSDGRLFFFFSFFSIYFIFHTLFLFESQH